MPTDKTQLKEAIRQEFKKCAEDPAHFLRRYCYIQHPQQGKIKFGNSELDGFVAPDFAENLMSISSLVNDKANNKEKMSEDRRQYRLENTLIDSIPMMQGINNILDFDFVFSFSAGYPGTVEWVQYGTDPSGGPMSTGTTSIQVNEVIP